MAEDYRLEEGDFEDVLETETEYEKADEESGVLLSDDDLQEIAGGAKMTIKEKVYHACPYCGTSREIVGYAGRWTLKNLRNLPTFWCYKKKKWFRVGSKGVYNYDGYQIAGA